MRTRYDVELLKKLWSCTESSAINCNATSNDAHGDFTQTIDADLHRVARLHRADTLGRPREDYIARFEAEEPRQICHRLRDRPDQMRHVALLFRLAIDRQPEASLLEVTGCAGGGNRPHRRGAVERPADFPRTPHFAHLHLQIAACHVEADRATPH